MQKVIVKARKEVLYVKYKYEVHGDESPQRKPLHSNKKEVPCLCVVILVLA